MPVDDEGRLTKVANLPPMPTVLIELQKLLRSSESDARNIARLVSHDVALTAQILRVVNSPYYGIGRQVLDLRFAVAYLGFNEVNRIVLTLSVVQSLAVADKKVLARFWFHSYYTALVAKELGKRYEPLIDPGELWPAALLHDVGQLVYMKLFPGHFAVLEEYRGQRRCRLVDAELALGLPSHSQLGELLCERWRLPDTIRDVCAHHHHPRPDRVDGTPLIRAFRRIVSCASSLTDVVDPEVEPGIREEESQSVKRLLKLDDGEFLTLVATVQDLREDAKAFASEIL